MFPPSYRPQTQRLTACSTSVVTGKSETFVPRTRRRANRRLSLHLRSESPDTAVIIYMRKRKEKSRRYLFVCPLSAENRLVRVMK